MYLLMTQKLKIAKKYDAEFIERPKKLNNSKALGDHVFEFDILK